MSSSIISAAGQECILSITQMLCSYFLWMWVLRKKLMYFETMWLYVVVLWCECCQNFSEAALPLVTKPAHQKSILGCLNVVLPLSSYPIAVRSNPPYPLPLLQTWSFSLLYPMRMWLDCCLGVVFLPSVFVYVRRLMPCKAATVTEQPTRWFHHFKRSQFLLKCC